MLALAGCNIDGDSSSASTSGGTPVSGPAGEVPTGDGNATLSWEAPTTTTNGETLTNLSGYRIYYGVSEDDLSQVVQLAGVGIQTYVIDNLGQGTWFFAIRAVTTQGVESSLSDIVSKTIS